MTFEPDHISLLITPDASAGRRVRSAIAGRNLGLGMKVLTWREVLEDVRLAYLLPPLEESWNETIRQAITEMGAGFWRRSFEVDPAGTTSVVAAALDEVIRNGDIARVCSHSSLSERTNSTLGDLRRLWEQTGDALPPELELIKAVREDPDRAISRFAVHWVDGWPRLDRFQLELVDLLNQHGRSPDQTFSEILHEAASLPEILETSSFPQRLANLCFVGGTDIPRAEEDISFLIARDPLQEIECALGMAQKMLSRGVLAREIGILLPDDAYYHRALADTMAVVGLLAAGLSTQISLRDLGGEIVRSLILLARGPVPKMALAALMTSPLAPWPDDIGLKMASDVMSGRFGLRSPKGISEEAEKALSVIRRLRDEKVSLAEAIEVFAHGNDDPPHNSRLRSLAGVIAEQEAGVGQLDHEHLLRLVGHVSTTADSPILFPQNGIRIFQESQEPWTTVEQLIVLGFNAGRYPAVPGASPVLHDLDKQAINEQLGWSLPTADIILSSRRERFQRQLASARTAIKIMASARSIDGSTVQLAETATFMAGLLGVELEDLFVPVDRDEIWLPRVREEMPSAPRQPAPKDLNLGRDLLSLRTNEDGETLPESPSSLETLLVSPLAWLLDRIDAEPDLWEPDTLSPLLQGNIAHFVFEHLFTVGGDIIEESAVVDAVNAALDEAIRQQAPLLSTAQWKVERHSLRTTLIQAVSHWRDVLETLDAMVVGSEARLKGTFNSVPIKGFSDAVLQLPGGKLVVVDYKKSSSGKRRERMELGYDCQVSLYERMIAQNPGELGFDQTSEKPGIVYYTLNDQRVLADDRTGLSADVPGLIVVPNDVSSNALSEIEERVVKLRRGIVEMNRDDDAKRLEKDKALPGFALEASPLVMMYARSAPAEDEA